jgi:ABC-type glycerol-3-phosphate transport system substrate-binding protein
MRRALMLLVTATLIASACSSGPSSSATQTPARTVDIKRSTLDIAYTAFVDQDVHNVTSKKAKWRRRLSRTRPRRS